MVFETGSLQVQRPVTTQLRELSGQGFPKGFLYFEDKPSFMISADHATVLNDGELVVLEGTVPLETPRSRASSYTGRPIDMEAGSINNDNQPKASCFKPKFKNYF
jgi:hypothetical protein